MTVLVLLDDQNPFLAEQNDVFVAKHASSAASRADCLYGSLGVCGKPAGRPSLRCISLFRSRPDFTVVQTHIQDVLGPGSQPLRDGFVASPCFCGVNQRSSCPARGKPLGGQVQADVKLVRVLLLAATAASRVGRLPVLRQPAPAASANRNKITLEFFLEVVEPLLELEVDFGASAFDAFDLALIFVLQGRCGLPASMLVAFESR